MIDDKDAKHKSLQKKIGWGLGLLGAFLIAPIVFMIVKGIVGLAIAGVVGLVVVNAAPVLAMKLANWKLGMLKGEAGKNPIETLQLQEIQQGKDLEEFANKITLFDSEVATYEQILVRENEDPNTNDILIGMKRLLTYRRTKYQEAQRETVNFSTQVREAERKYRLALAAQRVTKAAGSTEVDILNKILKEIAFNSVQNNVNTAMSELRTAIMKEDIQASYATAPDAKVSSITSLPNKPSKPANWVAFDDIKLVNKEGVSR